MRDFYLCYPAILTNTLVPQLGLSSILQNQLGVALDALTGSSSDLLQELLQLHERARLAMRSVAKALWPSDSPLGSMEKLVELFMGARWRI